jgi:uncharacterized protein YkwD
MYFNVPACRAAGNSYSSKSVNRRKAFIQTFMNAARFSLLCLVSLGTALAAVTPDSAKTIADSPLPTRSDALAPHNSIRNAVDPDLSRPMLVSVLPTPSDVLAAHNSIRNKVGLPPLAWSDELAHVAQKWADKLASAGEFHHSSDSRYGENLFRISGDGATSNAYEVVNAWGAESAAYHYQTNSCDSGECGHYTQIVWRETKKVGCAVARDPKHEVWVCEYAPYGNVIGQRPF